MGSNIRIIESRDIWDGFLNTLKPHTFLHSWNWSEFSTRHGEKAFRLGIYDGSNLVALALVLKVSAKRGSFLFIPHGPLGELNPENLNELVNYLKNIAEKESCSFIRVSPLLLKTPENEKLFSELGFRPAPTHMHSELCWILGIRKSEMELLKDMRKTTRYSVNKAEKDGVVIEMSDKLEDVKKFNEIYSATVERQHFTPFSLKYLEEEFEAFRKTGEALLFFAKYNGDIISSAMIIFSNGGAFYHHGASNLKYPKITGAYLLQWAVIKEAKRRGCEFYNFWGIAPENKKHHPWAGLSLFKKGFGGYQEEYVHAKDLRLKPNYWLTYAIEKARRIYRRL